KGEGQRDNNVPEHQPGGVEQAAGTVMGSVQRCVHVTPQGKVQGSDQRRWVSLSAGTASFQPRRERQYRLGARQCQNLPPKTSQEKSWQQQVTLCPGAPRLLRGGGFLRARVFAPCSSPWRRWPPACPARRRCRCRSGPPGRSAGRRPTA